VNWIIVGASSGLGRALAETLAAAKHDLVIVARDERDLAAIASDLAVRHGVVVRTCVADAAHPAALVAALTNIVGGKEHVDGIAFPVGAVSNADTVLEMTKDTDALFDINFRSIVTIIREYLPAMIERKRGWLIGFGSIASVRGRTNNATYAAAKAALRTYFESLRHACEGRHVVVQFYVLGYIDTALAFGRPLLLPKESATAVARRVVGNLNAGGGIWFLPRFWKPIAVALRLLPWTMFRRLNF
jgi:short-subunit dehydrogenase